MLDKERFKDAGSSPPQTFTTTDTRGAGESLVLLTNSCLISSTIFDYVVGLTR